MPPKIKTTKEQILNAAFEFVRENGYRALNARTLANVLHCSTQPIFSNYSSMNELRNDIIILANELYQSYQAKEISEGKYPIYKASGMAYIKFAKEQTQLFRLLFMRDRSEEKVAQDTSQIDFIIDIIQNNMGITREQALEFHLQMWLWVHGIASMIATGYLDWDIDFASDMLSTAFLGLKTQYVSDKE